MKMSRLCFVCVRLLCTWKHNRIQRIYWVCKLKCYHPEASPNSAWAAKPDGHPKTSESQSWKTSSETTWTFTKRKVKAFKTLNLIKQCNDTALALVRWIVTDLVYPVGVSHQTLRQQRIIQDDEGMTCYSTYSRKQMTHKGTLTSHYSPYNTPLAFKNPASFTRSHGLLRFVWSLCECVRILCDLT